MSQCRCEPHASGSNRCDACRYEMAEQSDPRSVTNQLASAIVLITAIAKDQILDTSCMCDSWLEHNGYECEASRRRERERRAKHLDAQIERLRAERAKL
jgi:hypothetical protein